MSRQPFAANWLASIGAIVVSLSHFGHSLPAQAQTDSSAATITPAPPELMEVITQFEDAANQHDLSAVMALFSPELSLADGLSAEQFAESLEQLWQRYPDLKYKTELVSWEETGPNSWMVETTTEISGTEQLGSKALQLLSTIRSRQHFSDQKLTQQEIISETTQISSGEKPPEIQFEVPNEVEIGEEFDLDAIALEPLGNDLLLGAVQESPAESESYLTSSPLELEILSAGGVFKLATAPEEPGDQWLSAILVQSHGLRIMTKRIKVQP